LDLKKTPGINTWGNFLKFLPQKKMITTAEESCFILFKNIREWYAQDPDSLLDWLLESSKDSETTFTDMFYLLVEFLMEDPENFSNLTLELMHEKTLEHVIELLESRVFPRRMANWL
jgi:hypothetical protein